MILRDQSGQDSRGVRRGLGAGREVWLLARHSKEWGKSLRGLARRWEFRRGFVEGVTLPAERPRSAAGSRGRNRQSPSYPVSRGHESQHHQRQQQMPDQPCVVTPLVVQQACLLLAKAETLLHTKAPRCWLSLAFQLLQLRRVG